MGRTFSWRLAVGGMAGAIIVTGDMLFEGIGGERHSWTRNAPIALPLGAGLAAWQYHRLRRKMTEEGVTHDAGGDALDDSQGIAVGKAVGIGAGVSAALYVAARGEKLFAGGVGSALTSMNPRMGYRSPGRACHARRWGSPGSRACSTCSPPRRPRVTRWRPRTRTHPTSEYVSAGPRSAVPLDTIGREGRRFVNMALTVEEIEAVMGGPAKPPIRVFVGLETKATTSERADMAMRELEALGAFERKHIVFMSPTGTGYLNYVTAESLEFLTRGDIACVAMQYSLRPSPLSLFRVGIGIDQNNAFLHALKWRLAAIPADQRPGCTSSVRAWARRPRRTSSPRRAPRACTAWVSTGACSSGPRRRRSSGTEAASDPESMDPDGEIIEARQLPGVPRPARGRPRPWPVFFLTHHNDSMPKFWFPLAVQAPAWMGPPRLASPGCPGRPRGGRTSRS